MKRFVGSSQPLDRWKIRRLIAPCWDVTWWFLASLLAALLRYDSALPEGVVKSCIVLGLLMGVCQLVFGYLVGIYRGRFVVSSFDEMLGVILTACATTVTGLALVLLLAPDYFARSIPLISGGIAMLCMVGGRVLLRFWSRHLALQRPGQRVLIYGAGEAGAQIALKMLNEPLGGNVPIGFLDDDSLKRRLRMHGLRVLGELSDLERLQTLTQASTLLVAIAGVDAATLSDLNRRCQNLDISLRVIPTTSEIIGGAVKLGDISDVTEEDLLGRRPVRTDERAITSFLRGKRILITGAGGSIGSEIARQIARYEPQEVGYLDRDESALHALQLSISGQGLLTQPGLLLADIRDTKRVLQVLTAFRPEIVFHAAALKHLPLLESAPSEAFKTNVIGTLNMLDASRSVGVSTFVNISTDKAAEPTSILGYSKLLTERSCAAFGIETESRVVSVRFGNVLGSRGSVIDTFRYQISHGGPVTVTDPNVTRYFMTIPEAVHLVLQAAAIGESGETLILDMGDPMRIDDVARGMIERSGRDIPIVYTGLRTGEKLDEILVAHYESTRSPVHPLISHTRSRPCDVDELRQVEVDEDQRRMAAILRSLALN